jgi:hypothetical protein
MHQPILFVLLTGLAGGAVIHVNPAKPLPVPTTRASAETSLVVTPGLRMLTYLGEPLSAQSARPGDTIYLRVASALFVGGQAVIAAGSYIEATVNRITTQASSGRIEIGLRFRRLLGAQGDVADIFSVDAAPNDSTYRRGVTAVADLPGRGQVVTMRSSIALVVESAFTVDTRRSLASAFGRKFRVVGSPPRLECLAQSVMWSPDVIIPGTPPTPAIGNFPGTPGTPDIIMPGTSNLSELWEPCR